MLAATRPSDEPSQPFSLLVHDIVKNLPLLLIRRLKRLLKAAVLLFSLEWSLHLNVCYLQFAKMFYVPG